MNEISNLRGELSNLVERLFSQKLQVHSQILQQIRQEINARQQLNNQILTSIDEQISQHRTRLREIENRFQHDATLWLHPRRNQIETQIGEWKKVRLQHQTTAWEHLRQLRQQYQDTWKELTETLQTHKLLQNTPQKQYP